MAPAPTEIGPFFATSHHAPIELPEHVLTTIVLLLRARSLYSGLIGGIGSVCRSWRRLAKGVLMGDELAWLRVEGAAEAAECLSSFPHAKSLRIVGDAAAGEIASALGSGSVARLAIANNSVMRDCEGLGELVGLRALCITKCRNLAPSLGGITQLTSLDLGGTLLVSAASWAVSGCLCLRVWARAVARRAVAGGGACRQSHRSRWGSVAGTESRKDDAAEVAVPRWYAACICGSCAVSGYLRTPAVHWMMLGGVGRGDGAQGCSVWVGECKRRAEGRRCVQTIRSDMMGQRRWHRVS